MNGGSIFAYMMCEWSKQAFSHNPNVSPLYREAYKALMEEIQHELRLNG